MDYHSGLDWLQIDRGDQYSLKLLNTSLKTFLSFLVNVLVRTSGLIIVPVQPLVTYSVYDLA